MRVVPVELGLGELFQGFDEGGEPARVRGRWGAAAAVFLRNRGGVARVEAGLHVGGDEALAEEEAERFAQLEGVALRGLVVAELAVRQDAWVGEIRPEQGAGKGGEGGEDAGAAGVELFWILCVNSGLAFVRGEGCNVRRYLRCLLVSMSRAWISLFRRDQNRQSPLNRLSL